MQSRRGERPARKITPSVISSSALKAAHVLPPRTYGRQPISAHCQPAVNMARTWNASPDLRAAPSLASARTVAKKLAFACRFEGMK